MLLFWPVGIFALLKAGNVNTLWVQGRCAESIQAAASARTLAKIGVIVGVAVFIGIIILTVLFMALLLTTADSVVYY